MVSVAVMAARDLSDGEEVFVDYRLGPKSDRPSWYEPCDSAEEERRWSPAA